MMDWKKEKEPDRSASRRALKHLTEGSRKNQKEKEESFNAGRPQGRCGQDPGKGLSWGWEGGRWKEPG